MKITQIPANAIPEQDKRPLGPFGQALENMAVGEALQIEGLESPSAGQTRANNIGRNLGRRFRTRLKDGVLYVERMS